MTWNDCLLASIWASRSLLSCLRRVARSISLSSFFSISSLSNSSFFMKSSACNQKSVINLTAQAKRVAHHWLTGPPSVHQGTKKARPKASVALQPSVGRCTEAEAGLVARLEVTHGLLQALHQVLELRWQGGPSSSQSKPKSLARLCASKNGCPCPQENSFPSRPHDILDGCIVDAHPITWKSTCLGALNSHLGPK